MSEDQLRELAQQKRDQYNQLTSDQQLEVDKVAFEMYLRWATESGEIYTEEEIAELEKKVRKNES